jgi:hypothetical protein
VRAPILFVALTIAACDSTARIPGLTSPSPVPQGPYALSGRVFEVMRGSRVPAADFAVLAVVATTSGCSSPCVSTTKFTYEGTTTGPDGRYLFAQMPPGRAVLLANSATHRQVCGAAAVLTAATELDVEITSRADPQPSPTLPAVRISGQMYEMTPAGRAGVGGAVLYLEWYNDAPFLYVYADEEGRYLACGIPRNWQIAFWPLVWHQGFEDPYVWHQFNADSTLDIELKRR